MNHRPEFSASLPVAGRRVLATARAFSWSLACAFACALALDAVAPAPACALETVARKGWTLGLGLGLGHGEITPPAPGEEFYAKDGATPGITIQRALSQRVRVGVAWQDWLTERGSGGERIRRSMQAWTATATFVPGNLENAWSGFYLRGGVGIASGRYSTADADEHGEDINLVATDQTGIAYTGGVGYEFHVSNDVAAGMLLTATYADYGDALFDHGWFVPLSVTVNWTF
ncbi:MAG: hypothetical protein ACREOU_06080 [Candidatus Eiseniibacteriota bacterium]